MAPATATEIPDPRVNIATDRAQCLWNLKVTEKNTIQRQEDKARKLETIFSLSSLRTQGHKAKELKTEKLRCELMAGVLERQVQEEQARK